MRCSFIFSHYPSIGLLWATALVVLVAQSANGEPIFFSDNPNGYMPALHAQGLHHDNVMFNAAGLELQGNTVEGFVNQSDFERVTISSTTTLTADGGQAPGVSALTGTFFDAIFGTHIENDVTSFRSLSLNIDANGNPTGQAGNVAVTLLDETGAPINAQPYEFSLSNGNNFLGVIGGDGMSFSALELVSDVALDRITQIRTSLGQGASTIPPGVPPSGPPGPPGPPVSSPEPSSMVLWLLAVVFAARWARERNRFKTASP